jgi:RNA polymerase sigma-70 factor (ECF subfamily)
MKQDEIIPHLFRTEFRKITAVLCKLFGIAYIGQAEDIASETFLSALETWPYRGVPENPVAWLYAVAKNKARNLIKRDQLFREKIAADLKLTEEQTTIVQVDLSEKNIMDSQLQMLFAICHPSIPPEAQVGLALRILCGFGIEEIANAFLTNKETINKRLFRAKEKLRTEKVPVAFPGDAALPGRMETVTTTLYLLFNEGYYSESNNNVLRRDLCDEAMRLVSLLIDNEKTNTPAVNALYALMCFHASRFDARTNGSGEIILYDEQEEKNWDQSLISQGVFYLNRAAVGKKYTRYHLEAAIAYWHTVKTDTTEKWENILQLYNQLLQIAYSPVAALNRTYALSRSYGKQMAIREAEKLQLHHNQYYHALLGELYTGIDDACAIRYFQTAIAIAKTAADQQVLQKKCDRILKQFPTKNNL